MYVKSFFNPDLFFDPGRFTLSTPKVKQPCSSYLTFSQQFDFFETWRDDRENPFYAYAVGNFSYSKGFPIGIYIFPLDHSSLKLLDTLFIAFSNFYVDIDGIPCFERWKL